MAYLKQEFTDYLLNIEHNNSPTADIASNKQICFKSDDGVEIEVRFIDLFDARTSIQTIEFA